MKTLSRILKLLSGMALLLTACNLKSPSTQTTTPAPVVKIITDTPSTADNPEVAVSSSSSITQNANCRTGPGTEYETVDVLLQGQAVLIDGRNEENDWFRVQNPSDNDHCWVSASMVTTDVDTSNLMVFAAPPLPSKVAGTPGVITPTPTAADLTPPIISHVSISPTMIQKAGCGTPNTFTINATVTDESGIGNVIYEIIGPGPMDQGDGYLLPVGGDHYEAVVGPISGNAGDWTLTLTSMDMAFNEAEAGPWIIQIVCIQ
jgi:uncharacterized protein YraI